MKIPRLRWLMISLIFLATVINYIDRQTVSVLKTSISTDLSLSNADYAAIQNSFLVLYGISQMVSGRLYDRIGTRLGFIFSIVVWSAAAMAHAFARTAGQFQFFRAVLGFGEAGNWPGAAKLVGEWFPVKERALGMGIFNTGAALGGAVSPGWRSPTAGAPPSSSRAPWASCGCCCGSCCIACPSSTPGSPRPNGRTSSRIGPPTAPSR